ncbi:anti-sigma factor [Pusillimonas sp. DMV24BSW_D]|uniref:cupin domain-containing protein n=1 Tax=Neopusillimonas aestuarii TaxID=2716226 RepID=UPI00140A9267|nr:cupin domain-containing protein [Pusillimonas sp. DMV24BSW_D]QIM48173.1 anti-sigma factor [Pusillimonas sp. DMV24BSW_D]
MRINADFSKPAFVLPDQYEWVSSPQAGVERVMLDRVGEEKARATSVVRYAPQSFFPVHSHPGGEEILVLSGTFSEDNRHYPAGWYLRSPPGSSHRPFSEEGVVIFVKLWQMGGEETSEVRIDTNNPANWVVEPEREYCPLYSDSSENVRLVRLPAGASLFSGSMPGAEIFVLQGSVLDRQRTYSSGSWIRLPEGVYPGFAAGGQGAKFYIKTGRLGEH